MNAKASTLSVAVPDVTGRKSTYGEILTSTTLIGASSVLTLAIGMVRTKVMAVLLGPAGFGLMGIFTSIADMTRGVAELGINSSGVRQIAQAAGSGDVQRIALTALVLRRAAVFLGMFGALLLVLLARPVATLTFGDDTHAGAVALLSIAVFLRLVADGQGALLQGMRRIADMARIGVLGSLFGTLLSIPVVYYLRADGIVPALVVVAAVSAAMSWWYSRSLAAPAARVTLTTTEVRQELAPLLRLGFAFMASGFLTLGAAYAVRAILVRFEGVEAAGLFQAAWTVGGLYVGFVLQAMGADFYPRLVAAADDDASCNRLVNEQAQVSVLLAGAGVIATLTLAPWVVSLLYSAEFGAATGVLRWVCLGMAMRAITWPMGYILIAKGRQTIFVVVDLAWAVANVGLSWICVRLFGLEGAGIAFFASYVLHLLILYPVCARMTGFRWSAANLRTGLVFVSVIGIVHVTFHELGGLAAMAVGSMATLWSAGYSLHTLRRLVPAQDVPKRFAWLMKLDKEGT